MRISKNGGTTKFMLMENTEYSFVYIHIKHIKTLDIIEINCFNNLNVDGLLCSDNVMHKLLLLYS